MFHVVYVVLKQKVEKFMFPVIQLSTGYVQVKKIYCVQHVVHSLLFMYEEFLRCAHVYTYGTTLLYSSKNILYL